MTWWCGTGGAARAGHAPHRGARGERPPAGPPRAARAGAVSGVPLRQPQDRAGPAAAGQPAALGRRQGTLQHTMSSVCSLSLKLFERNIDN